MAYDGGNVDAALAEAEETEDRRRAQGIRVHPRQLRRTMTRLRLLPL